MKFSVDCIQKGQIVRTFCGGVLTIHSNGQTISCFIHIEVITLGTGKGIYEIDRREIVIGLNGIGRAGEGLYGTFFL